MNPWQLSGSQARLLSKELTARIDLMQPAAGLHDIRWNESTIAGSVLGVTVSEGDGARRQLSTASMDQFVRDNDLVANFLQDQSQPFTLQIYWRVNDGGPSIRIIDAIVSLQTSLLECYPKAILATTLPADQCMIINEEVISEVRQNERFQRSDPAALLLRGHNNDWSYLEVTHPDDLGTWRVDYGNSIDIARDLGGEFQEKGVIRRLRVRSAFLPREDDLNLARRLTKEFSEAPPPLTA